MYVIISFIKFKKSHGFTLLEILLVVGIIAILAGIVILAINPTKQLGDTRNAQRRSDVLTILNAVYQYAIDNDGDIPEDILENPDGDEVGCVDDGSGDYEIMKSDTASGIAKVDLQTDLVGNDSDYLTAIPVDPIRTADDVDTGYFIYKAPNNRITVCAPFSIGEGSISSSTMIKVTR